MSDFEELNKLLDSYEEELAAEEVVDTSLACKIFCALKPFIEDEVIPWIKDNVPSPAGPIIARVLEKLIQLLDILCKLAGNPCTA